MDTEFLETKIAKLLTITEEFIEQAAEEYAANLGREGDDFDADKLLAIEYLNAKIKIVA